MLATVLETAHETGSLRPTASSAASPATGASQRNDCRRGRTEKMLEFSKFSRHIAKGVA